MNKNSNEEQGKPVTPKNSIIYNVISAVSLTCSSVWYWWRGESSNLIAAVKAISLSSMLVTMFVRRKPSFEVIVAATASSASGPNPIVDMLKNGARSSVDYVIDKKEPLLFAFTSTYAAILVAESDTNRRIADLRSQACEQKTALIAVNKALEKQIEELKATLKIRDNTTLTALSNNDQASSEIHILQVENTKLRSKLSELQKLVTDLQLRGNDDSVPAATSERNPNPSTFSPRH